MKTKGKRSRGGSHPRMRKLEIDLGDRRVPIRIGWQTLRDVGPEIARRTGASEAAVVTVASVGRRYGAELARSLRSAGIRAHRFEVPDGDSTKNLQQAQRLYRAFLARGIDRKSVVVALGGGMVGDLAGFVAATFMRGVPFVQIPSTLLSMVDASVGGKVGVNLPEGKNLVGAFYQPSLVWLDASLLQSLPPRLVSAGMAEVIKAAAIRDAKFFARLERELPRILALEPSALLPVLERSCAIKADVVARDERESGLRRILNFGHTLGHAVEKARRYRGVLHGEAVAMGMVYAARRSEELGLAKPETALRLEDLIARAELPTELPNFSRKVYLDALRVDKKRVGSKIGYVVLRAIGRSDVVELSPAEILPASFGRRTGR